jgi:hypothetical protein
MLPETKLDELKWLAEGAMYTSGPKAFVTVLAEDLIDLLVEARRGSEADAWERKAAELERENTRLLEEDVDCYYCGGNR